VRRKGLTVKSGDIVKTNPAIHVSNQAWRLVRAFGSEFGLSPVSRTRLTIEKPDAGDQDLMKILSQPREPRPQTKRVQ
jgi:P27 family predicted phage terminase small subunit